LRLNSPTDWGQLICSSTVVLGNPLQVSFAYAPTVGGQFRIISGTSLTGTFAPVNVQDGVASVLYNATSAFLYITNTIPQLLSPTVTAGNFSFYLNTASGQNYTVEDSDNVYAANWMVYTNFTGNGSLMQVIVPVAGVPHRFFRVRQP
jgi:hypothetical protein